MWLTTHTTLINNANGFITFSPNSSTTLIAPWRGDGRRGYGISPSNPEHLAQTWHMRHRLHVGSPPSTDHLVFLGPLTPAALKLKKGPNSPSIRSQSLCRPCRGQPSHSWAGALVCCTAATVKACFRVIIISSTWSKRRESVASRKSI